MVSFSGFANKFMEDVISSPLNMVLVGLICYFSYKLFVRDGSGGGGKSDEKKEVKKFTKMPKRDFTHEELKPFNGTREDGRILIAVLGKVFDVSNSNHFYGPDGPYAAFGGRDASRALATFAIEDKMFKDTHDDLSDLTPSQMESVKEWEMQFLGILSWLLFI
jgi:membrane-associated progesterone receptor component